MSGDDGDGNGEEEKGEKEEEGSPTDQIEEGDTDTRFRSHEPLDDMPSQPSTTSLPSMESDHCVGLLNNETSMDIPVSSVPTMPPMQPTHISG